MWSFGAFFMLVTLDVVIGQDTQEELDYKEKHFCEGDETGKLLEGADSGAVVETKRCGFDKSGKPMCMMCNTCAGGFKREGTSCTKGQETQEELDYKEKHFCEGDETGKYLKSADSGAVVETKRCGFDKSGKPMCMLCNKCASGFKREGTSCINGQQTQEELDYKEKHFCEGDETGKYLKGSDSGAVVETKRCGFDKSGKPMCMLCNKCASGFKRDGTNCTSGSASGSASAKSGTSVVPIIAAGAIFLALLAGLFLAFKLKRGSRSDGEDGNIRGATLRSGKAASRRGGRSQRR